MDPVSFSLGFFLGGMLGIAVMNIVFSFQRKSKNKDAQQVWLKYDGGRFAKANLKTNPWREKYCWWDEESEQGLIFLLEDGTVKTDEVSQHVTNWKFVETGDSR